MNHSRSSKPIERLVLIGIANHDGDGGAWPTVARLARYAACSTRAVQFAIVELERLGEIKRDIQSGGTLEIASYDRPNLYHFLLKCPPHCDGTRNHKLICDGCKKGMPNASQLTRFHAGCAPEIGVPVPGEPRSPGEPPFTRGVNPRSPKPYLEPLTTLNEESHLPDRAREAVADAPNEAASGPGPAVVADAPEKEPQSGRPSSAFDIPAAVARAARADAQRAADAHNPIDPDEACPRRAAAPHAYTKAGECIDCGAPSPARIDPNTGEVA